jgi:hypothetical protein
MPNTENLLNGLEPGLALQFFATFARLEFAMKYSGCLKRTDNGRVAEASPSRLSARLPADFFENVRASGAADVIINEPPKNLYVLADGSLGFEPVAGPLTNTMDLLNAVWRVRNNLFHGNKMHPTNRARDTELMRSALVVIDAVLHAEHAIGGAFREPQQFF